MKAEVAKKLGKPNGVRSAKYVTPESEYALHEYLLYDTRCLAWVSALVIVPPYPICSAKPYWLHYVDDQLIFWGPKDDWQGAPSWFISKNQKQKEQAEKEEKK